MLNFLFRATNGGKTSLSEQLQLYFTGCRVINMDEYFHVIKVISIECRVESSGVARGAGGASAPGRRLEGGAKILPRNFFKFI